MNNGQNIPQGYKKTTIGFIPQGWEIKRLKTIVTPVKTFSYSRDKLSDNVQTLIYIHYGDIHKSGEKYSVNLNVDRLPYLMDGILSENQISANDFPKLQSGDILLPDASEDYDGIGHAWELQNVGQQNVIGGLHTIAIRPNPQFVLLGYGSLMFYSWPVSKALKRIAQGTKVYSISFNLIDNIKILLPPLKEQQKIAEVLGTWDKTIEKQTQLIKKLELRKKGLMQQLLTGKKRLLGFNKKWEKIKLGKIGKFDKGFGVPKDSIKENGNKAITYGEIYTKYNYVIKNVASYIDDETASISKKITRGAILFTGSGETLEDIGKCVAFIDNDVAYAGGDIIIFNPSIGINSVVLSYCLNSSPVNAQKWKYGQGFSVVHIYQKDLAKIQIEIPSLEEQTAIAQVLTAADHEIELAQQKLELLRQQKRGLMQQLLTGKKRIKI